MKLALNVLLLASLVTPTQAIVGWIVNGMMSWFAPNLLDNVCGLATDTIFDTAGATADEFGVGISCGCDGRFSFFATEFNFGITCGVGDSSSNVTDFCLDEESGLCGSCEIGGDTTIQFVGNAFQVIFSGPESLLEGQDINIDGKCMLTEEILELGDEFEFDVTIAGTLDGGNFGVLVKSCELLDGEGKDICVCEAGKALDGTPCDSVGAISYDCSAAFPDGPVADCSDLVPF